MEAAARPAGWPRGTLPLLPASGDGTASVARRPRAGRPGAFAGELWQRLQGPAAPAGQDAPAWEPSAVGEVSPDQLPEGRPALVWAARELEAQLWVWMLNQALQSGAGGGPFGRGFAASVYQDWLARSVAELLVQSGPTPLSERLVDQLSPPGGR